MPETTIYDIATKYDIIEGAPNRTLESAILIMGTKKFRRLPITKLGRIRGILTVTDILRAITEKGLPDAFNEDISDWMTVEPKTASPATTIKEATKRMSEGNFGSLLVVDEDNNILKGILTERDILKYFKNKDWPTRLNDIDDKLLTQELVKVDERISLEDAIKEMSRNNTHRVLTMRGDELTGILSANDITSLCANEHEEISANENFLKSITAAFVKTSNVVTIEHTTTLTEAIKIMNEKNIGALPITKGDEILGFFSERSLVHYIAKYL